MKGMNWGHNNLDMANFIVTSQQLHGQSHAIQRINKQFIDVGQTETKPMHTELHLLLFCRLLWISLPYSNTYRNLRDGV
jgi:hypothetical protein